MSHCSTAICNNVSKRYTLSHRSVRKVNSHKGPVSHLRCCDLSKSPKTSFPTTCTEKRFLEFSRDHNISGLRHGLLILSICLSGWHDAMDADDPNERGDAYRLTGTIKTSSQHERNSKKLVHVEPSVDISRP